MPDKNKKQVGGSPKYTTKELKLKNFICQRISELKDTRKDVFGMDLETVWRQADKDYVPHKLSKGVQKTLVQNEDEGLASRYVEIGKAQWRTDNANMNPYIKIQTALAIIIARNPSVDLTPDSEKYEQTTKIQEELYKKSWEKAKSLEQLKLFAFNLAKYGWAVARTYPKVIKNPSKVVINYDPEKDKQKYETTESVEFNGVFRENLDPWKTWIDDRSLPNRPTSTRDWCFAKDYSWHQLEKEFGKTKNFKHIQTGRSDDVDESSKESMKTILQKDNKIVYFYENLDKDTIAVVCDGILLKSEPLPLSDGRGNKRLSLWHTNWTLRHAESPYGIGINEAMRHDKVLYDKLRNMSVDQIILSIYKMFFYSGTDQMDGDGKIEVRPGVGVQVTDPKNMNILQVPGPGKDAYMGIEMMQKAIDDASGIGKELMGQTEEKTAFQSAQNAEFGLRRLKTPLENITSALETDSELIQIIHEMIYSIPEVIKITNPDTIKAYFEEIQGDPELYERDAEGNFSAKLYPEQQMGIDTDDEGKLIESEESKFFRLKPSGLKWEGMIRVKGQSLLIETKALAKQMVTDVFNIVTPLFMQPAELVMKPIKELLKKYDLDWKDWVPDMWMQPQQNVGSMGGLFIDAQGGGGGRPQSGGQTVVPRSQTRPTGAVASTPAQGSRSAAAMGR
jgi:hypothetical protein